jgi:D-alanyl-D-alanine-carboxypeptidase/D-alanyl-D-alanine-endopeptidase
MGVLDGAGALVSTANDLVRLLEAVTGLKRTRLTATFDVACTPLVSIGGGEQMAYGFKIKSSSKGGVYYGKPGEVAGYSAMIVWRRDPRIGVVFLANRGNFGKIAGLGAKLIESVVR